jgi:hypothetical protein
MVAEVLLITLQRIRNHQKKSTLKKLTEEGKKERAKKKDINKIKTNKKHHQKNRQLQRI